MLERSRSRRATVAVLLASAALASVLTGCGGGGESAEPATTEAPGTEATAPSGDAANGAMVFESAGCGGCHTLAAASSTGTVGPNLDELKPSFETVVAQVTNGGGRMPAFAGRLSEQEINDVAAYVVESTGG